MKNKGKKFEELISESCEICGGIQVTRLKDGSSRTDGNSIIRIKCKPPMITPVLNHHDFILSQTNIFSTPFHSFLLAISMDNLLYVV